MKSQIDKFFPMRFHSTKPGETFDGPPTLERSGSEHRRAVTSFLLRRKAWLEVELPLERETEGFENSFFNGKEGRDDFRKSYNKNKN